MTYTFKLARRLAMWFLFGTVAFMLSAIAVSVLPFPPTILDVPLSWMVAIHRGLTNLLHLRLPPLFLHFLVAWFGSVAGQVFSFQRDFPRSTQFLRQVFPNRGEVFYARMDLWVSSVMGSIIGMILVNPSNVYTSLLTGLSWPVLVRGAMGAVKAVAGEREASEVNPTPVSLGVLGRELPFDATSRDSRAPSQLAELPPAA